MSDPGKTEDIRLILAECDRQDLPLLTQKAYVLATVEHETAGKFQPVVESFWVDDPVKYNRKHHPEYFPWYGRGYIQLTWERNYRKYAELLHIDLVGQPDLALEPAVARFILVHGFKHGTFTGHKLEDYVRKHRTWFKNARRCVNGTDKASHIAGVADRWVTRLCTAKIAD
jgi:predicted chitinase